MVLDDAEGRGQAQAGAGPISLVVKKGSKMRLRVASSMPTPRSLTPTLTKRPGRTWKARGSLSGQLQVLRVDGDLAAMGHGLPGIDQEVEQHLLDLGAVDLHRPELRFQNGEQGDLLARAPEQFDRVPDQLVQVGWPASYLPPRASPSSWRVSSEALRTWSSIALRCA